MKLKMIIKSTQFYISSTELSNIHAARWILSPVDPQNWFDQEIQIVVCIKIETQNVTHSARYYEQILLLTVTQILFCLNNPLLGGITLIPSCVPKDVSLERPASWLDLASGWIKVALELVKARSTFVLKQHGLGWWNKNAWVWYFEIQFRN